MATAIDLSKRGRNKAAPRALTFAPCVGSLKPVDHRQDGEDDSHDNGNYRRIVARCIHDQSTAARVGGIVVNADLLAGRKVIFLANLADMPVAREQLQRATAIRFPCDGKIHLNQRDRPHAPSRTIRHDGLQLAHLSSSDDETRQSALDALPLEPNE